MLFSVIYWTMPVFKSQRNPFSIYWLIKLVERRGWTLSLSRITEAGTSLWKGCRCCFSIQASPIENIVSSFVFRTPNYLSSFLHLPLEFRVIQSVGIRLALGSMHLHLNTGPITVDQNSGVALPFDRLNRFEKSNHVIYRLRRWLDCHRIRLPFANKWQSIKNYDTKNLSVTILDQPDELMMCSFIICRGPTAFFEEDDCVTADL